jgi:serine/threonine protein kinase
MVLGGTGPTIAVVAVLGLAWLATLEWTVPWRMGVVGLGIAGLIGGNELEVRFHRVRQAVRVAGYVLERELGRGGMGTVYRAYDPRTRQRVALKLVDPALLATEAERALYRREARTLADLDDPRVVRVFSWGEWTVLNGANRQPTAYLVMELIRGESLREYLGRTGPLPAGVACAIVREMALGLVTVHAQGVVHRDIKPDNVMLTATGELKLMDFGAARQTGNLTRSTVQVLGTLGYLPPEQGRGQAPDPRSDVYAAGVVLYELLMGQRPFVATDLVQMMAMVLESEPPPIRARRPDVSEDLVALVAHAMAKDPGARVSSAQALADALEPFADETLPYGMRPGEAERVVVRTSLRTSAAARQGGLMQLMWMYMRHVRTGDGDLASFAASVLADAARKDPSLRHRPDIQEAGATIYGADTVTIRGPETESDAPTAEHTWVDGSDS